MTAPHCWTRLALGASLACAPVAALAAQAPSAAPNDLRLDSVPRVVGEGTVSTPAEEFRATTSPDGATLLYTVTDHRFRHMTIVRAERRGDAWSAPEVAPFSGVWRDGDPAFAPDGREVLFVSNRPLPSDPPGTVRRDFNIWSVPRHPDGTWGEPVALGGAINTDSAEFAPSLTADGTLYFSRGDRMYRAARRGAGFDAPVALPLAGGDPAIAPDERFVVYDADGATPGDADLFLSCRTGTGWSVPRRLASPVSTPHEEGDPWVSADGRTLYFFSRRFTTAAERAPRARRATYAEIEREAIENPFNGSRNLYAVALPPSLCAAEGGR